MGIDTRHPAASAALTWWSRCRDCAAGSDAVKAQGPRYLPRLDGQPLLGPEYPAYLLRALFYNATGRTIDGLAGLVHQKPPDVTLPSALLDHVMDITLTGETLALVGLRATREVLTTGRYGILVDLSDAETTDPRPYWVGYPAEDIISWRVERRSGDEVVTRVVLREVVEDVGEDPYTVAFGVRYRELFLNDAGAYQVRLWAKLPTSHVVGGKTIWLPTDPVTPMRRGEPLTFLPFVFLGPDSLSPTVARPPLLDLVDVNLSHYRSSADREHALHFTAAPTAWVSGAKGTGPLRIGSSVAWDLGENGRADFLEFKGTGIGAIERAMAEKRELMATLGGRLLDAAPKGSETAEAARLRHAGDHATIRTIAAVLSAGLTWALQVHGWWVGPEATPTEVPARVELHRDFTSVRMSPDDLRAQILAWQSGAISFETLHANLVRGEVMRPGISADDERAAIARDDGSSGATE
jgi:hypothetical protein